MVSNPNKDHALLSVILCPFLSISSPHWSIKWNLLIHIVSDVAVDVILIFQSLFWIIFPDDGSFKYFFPRPLYIVDISHAIFNTVRKLWVLYTFSRIMISNEFLTKRAFKASAACCIHHCFMCATKHVLIIYTHWDSSSKESYNLLVECHNSQMNQNHLIPF